MTQSRTKGKGGSQPSKWERGGVISRLRTPTAIANETRNAARRKIHAYCYVCLGDHLWNEQHDGAKSVGVVRQSDCRMCHQPFALNQLGPETFYCSDACRYAAKKARARRYYQEAKERSA